MAIRDIREIRILPPLVLGRLGSSEQPMDNYRVEVDEPLGYRKLVPGPTLEVSPRTGEITSADVPKTVRFRDDNQLIKPVSPFLEVWARFEQDGPLVPLTAVHLRQLDLTPADIKWNIIAANLKAFRRTGDVNDKIEANIPALSNHDSQPLNGSAKNFVDGKSIPLGSVRYIRPNAMFPQIRLRFTPATGKVYGPQVGRRDRNVVDSVYDPQKGDWLNYFDGRRNTPTSTTPGAIYAGTDTVDQVWHISRGYLDDTCSGIAEVTLKVGTRSLKAYAHFTSGPPAFAPDSFPVRTIADELEQVAFGPEVSAGTADQQKVIEIVRRALETVRLLNTSVMNGNQGVGGLPVRDSRGQLNNNNNMAGQDTGLRRAFTPIFDPSVVDALAVRARHERILLALTGGTPIWFVRILRRFDQVGDLTDEGRRRMPGMMRGADGLYLALTRRQYNTIKASAPLQGQLDEGSAATSDFFGVKNEIRAQSKEIRAAKKKSVSSKTSRP
jgi:hypothetical protein